MKRKRKQKSRFKTLANLTETSSGGNNTYIMETQKYLHLN